MSCTDIRRINIYIFSTLPLDVENIDINTPEPEDDCAADDVFVNGIPVEGEVPANRRMMLARLVFIKKSSACTLKNYRIFAILS